MHMRIRRYIFRHMRIKKPICWHFTKEGIRFEWGLPRIVSDMSWREETNLYSLNSPCISLSVEGVTDCLLKVDFWLVMVGGSTVGKAGDCLDWIAGGLEMKELKDSDNP